MLSVQVIALDWGTALKDILCLFFGSPEPKAHKVSL